MPRTPDRPSSAEPQDEQYASRYWDRLRAGSNKWSEQQIDRLKKAMIEGFESSSQTGIFGVLVGPAGITEEWREKLSAYRELAKNAGFEIGQFSFNADAFTVQATIRKAAQNA